MNEADTGRFTLTVAGLPRSALTVVEFTGTEEISRPYSFSILVVSDRDDLEIMDRAATFAIRGLAALDNRFSYHGIITQCEYHHSLANLFSYRVTLEPRLTRLARTRHSDAYLDEETIPELVARILRADGAAHALTGRGPACTSMMNPGSPSFPGTSSMRACIIIFARRRTGRSW